MFSYRRGCCVIHELIIFFIFVVVQSQNISALLKAANIKADAAWVSAFAKLATLRKVSEFTTLSAAPSSGAAAPAAAAAAAPAAGKKDEKPAKKDTSEEEGDMGMGLFD
jgi:ribosomal protein L12E/L44/L45/RPP1/RPP2